MVITVVIKLVVVVVVVVGIADATSHKLYICRTRSKSIMLITINGKRGSSKHNSSGIIMV